MFFGCLSTSSLSSSPSASLTSTRGSSSPLSSSPSPLTSTLGSKWRPQLSVCLLALRCGGGSASQRHLCARNSHLHVYFLNDKKEWSLFWNILRTFTTLLSPSYRIFIKPFLERMHLCFYFMPRSTFLQRCLYFDLLHKLTLPRCSDSYLHCKHFKPSLGSAYKGPPSYLDFLRQSTSLLDVEGRLEKRPF